MYVKIIVTFLFVISLSFVNAQVNKVESKDSSSWTTKTIDLSKGKAQLRMVVDVPPNDRIRAFHVNRTICDERITEIDRDLNSMSIMAEPGPVSRDIAKRLYAISGIVSLTFEPYSVTVEIGKAFTWQEIEPKVIATLRHVSLALKRDQVTVNVTRAGRAVTVMVSKAPNPLFRSFSTRQLISKAEISNWAHPFSPYMGKRNEELRKMGLLGATLAEKLTSIEGVNEVFVTPYEVSVTIGGAFTWAEIQPSVVAILQNEIARHKSSS